MGGLWVAIPSQSDGFTVALGWLWVALHGLGRPGEGAFGTTKYSKYPNSRTSGWTGGARRPCEQCFLSQPFVIRVFGVLRGLDCRFSGKASSYLIIRDRSPDRH